MRMRRLPLRMRVRGLSVRQLAVRLVRRLPVRWMRGLAVRREGGLPGTLVQHSRTVMVVDLADASQVGGLIVVMGLMKKVRGLGGTTVFILQLRSSRRSWGKVMGFRNS